MAERSCILRFNWLENAIDWPGQNLHKATCVRTQTLKIFMHLHSFAFHVFILSYFLCFNMSMFILFIQIEKYHEHVKQTSLKSGKSTKEVCLDSQGLCMQGH